ncbi:MAG: insulinase family protein [Thermoplasmata archaeon]|nr:insulinase family protein [Thermoplasmata archaeon]
MASERVDPTRVSRRLLDSGMELVHQPSPPSAASFSATYIGPAGWAYDAPAEAGTAVATTQLLSSGAGPWDRVAFDRRLDQLGSTFSRRCDPESVEVAVWGPEAEWRALVDLLAQVVLHPRLEASDLERVRRQLIERQLREATQPDSRAEVELAHTVFPKGHPYRESGIGTRSTIARLRRETVRAFHRRHFTPEGAQLVLTGRANTDTVARYLDRAFRGWSQQRVPPPPDTPTLRTPSQEPVRITLPGTAQVEIRMGGGSIPRLSPEFPGSYLANQVLGGRSLLSRLFQVVREKHGLAYHASSELEAMRWGGYWEAAAGTGPERVDDTLRLLAREVRRIAEEEVPLAEIKSIRESAIGELPLSLETTSGAHQLACDIAYHHLPEEFLHRWPDTLRELTPARIRAAASTALDARRAATVVAGPPSVGNRPPRR